MLKVFAAWRSVFRFVFSFYFTRFSVTNQLRFISGGAAPRAAAESSSDCALGRRRILLGGRAPALIEGNPE